MTVQMKDRLLEQANAPSSCLLQAKAPHAAVSGAIGANTPCKRHVVFIARRPGWIRSVSAAAYLRSLPIKDEDIASSLRFLRIVLARQTHLNSKYYVGVLRPSSLCVVIIGRLTVKSIHL